MTIPLKAYSQAYILITLMPEMTSFMIRTRWSVTSADLNLGGDGSEGREEGGGRRGARRGERRKERRIRGSGIIYVSEPYEKEKERQMLPEMCKESGEAYLQWNL